MALTYKSGFQVGAREADQMWHLYPFLAHFWHFSKTTYLTIPKDVIIVLNLGTTSI